MEFGILGPLSVASGSGPVVIGAKRLRSVLAILLLHPSVTVSMDRLIDGVWPERPPRSAVENIRTYVWQLRCLLDEAGDEGRLESRPGSYRLLAELEELDLLRFTTLVADGRRALQRGSAREAAVLLERAARLWRGDALSELELGPAMRAKTAALDEERRAVELEWISSRLAIGDYAQMAAVLRQLTIERPLDEGLWRYLVVSLYSMGRAAEALSAYAEARSYLVSELGIEPGPELQKAQAAILAGEEIPNVPHGRGADLLAPTMIPRQLPAVDPGFIGRDEAISEICELAGTVQSDAARRGVATISGPPGVGKTATAVAAATSASQDFPDGQLFVDLRGSSDWPLSPADALARVLDGFGLRPSVIPDTMDRRHALYRSLLAERKMLILLDDAGSGSQVEPLIPGQGPSLLIVTSPRLLAGTAADVRINLAPLTSADAIRMLGQLIGQDRVDSERPAALDIVDACARLPLAIRIAGARLAARPEYPLWMFSEWFCLEDHIMDELTLDDLAMRSRLDARYQALDPAARSSFRALGKLRPDAITAGALSEVLRLPARAADRELERLVHEGLLIPGRIRHNIQGYRIPSLLHVYARERLAADGAELGIA